MNSDYYINTSDFHLSPPSPDGQDIFRRPSHFSTTTNYHQNPRKKRTKMIPIDHNTHPISKPKKPDPSAPKITRPCTECGKKFWSWKALFGHMRCHPERQWRGINPPPNLKKSHSGGSGTSYGDDLGTLMTDDDHHVATCLLMLANGPISVRDQTPTVMAAAAITNVGFSDSEIGFRDVGSFSGFGDYDGSSGSNCRFECSSCKKVFGSHQALGGHRASHKNVKGCFAITKTEGEEDVVLQEPVGGDHERNNIIGEGRPMDPSNSTIATLSGSGTCAVQMIHRCDICLRVFSSGQALGGHKRCHWEKVGDEPVNAGGFPSMVTQGLNVGSLGLTACGLDLNVPARVDDASTSVTNSSNLTLDLRLGF